MTNNYEHWDALYRSAVAPLPWDVGLTEFMHALARLVAIGGILGITCYSQLPNQSAATAARVGRLGNTIYHRTAEVVLDATPTGLRLVRYSPSALGPRRQHQAHCFTFASLPDAGRQC